MPLPLTSAFASLNQSLSPTLGESPGPETGNPVDATAFNAVLDRQFLAHPGMEIAAAPGNSLPGQELQSIELSPRMRVTVHGLTPPDEDSLLALARSQGISEAVLDLLRGNARTQTATGSDASAASELAPAKVDSTAESDPGFPWVAAAMAHPFAAPAIPPASVPLAPRTGTGNALTPAVAILDLADGGGVLRLPANARQGANGIRSSTIATTGRADQDGQENPGIRHPIPGNAASTALTAGFDVRADPDFSVHPPGSLAQAVPSGGSEQTGNPSAATTDSKRVLEAPGVATMPGGTAGDPGIASVVGMAGITGSAGFPAIASPARRSDQSPECRDFSAAAAPASALDATSAQTTISDPRPAGPGPVSQVWLNPSELGALWALGNRTAGRRPDESIDHAAAQPLSADPTGIATLPTRAADAPAPAATTSSVASSLWQSPSAQAFDQLSGKMAEALGQRLIAAIAQGNWQLNLQLNPARLGRLELRLTVNGNRDIQADFRTPHSHTRELLLAGEVRLRDMLDQAGLQLGQLNVALDDQGKQGGGQPGRHLSSGPPDADNRQGLPAEPALPENTGPATVLSQLLLHERLDVLV